MTPTRRRCSRLLRRELDASIAGTSATARVDVVRAAVLDRRIRRLGVQTFELGKRIVDGGVPRDDARAQGEALMKQLEAVTAAVRMLADASARPGWAAMSRRRASRRSMRSKARR